MAGMIPWLQPSEPFPALEKALVEPNGLLAAGGTLDPERLVEAYRHGIFPWFNEGEPILWWSPDPRMVLLPAEVRVTRSLAKSLRRRNHTVRADSAFREVMRACAGPRDGRAGTWINNDMISAYCALHDRGIAHSIEIWIDGALAGGLYGVALGRMFYGESMFTRAIELLMRFTSPVSTFPAPYSQTASGALEVTAFSTHSTQRTRPHT